MISICGGKVLILGITSLNRVGLSVLTTIILEDKLATLITCLSPKPRQLIFPICYSLPPSSPWPTTRSPPPLSLLALASLQIPSSRSSLLSPPPHPPYALLHPRSPLMFSRACSHYSYRDEVHYIFEFCGVEGLAWPGGRLEDRLGLVGWW